MKACVLLFFAMLSCLSASASLPEKGQGNAGMDVDIEIQHVRLRTIEGAQFFRMREYFTGEENQGRRLILRSDPDSRGGWYFVVRLSRRLDSLPDGMSAHLVLVETESSQRIPFQFDLPSTRPSTRTLYVGITDPGRVDKPLPIAWRLALVGPDGREWADHPSYLWATQLDTPD